MSESTPDSSLKVVNYSLQETLELTNSWTEILHHPAQRTPIVWYGGRDTRGHDVSIILVPDEITQQAKKLGEESEHHREILAILKVHSGRLSKCSKYFEACLNERWMKPSSSSSSLEFVLETHTDVAGYTDCLSHMYTPTFHKGFKDVEYSLKLLKVALQIQYLELMDSILLYLSSKAWSDADAAMIDLYAASPDFPREHAEDLIVRLEMDKSKEDWHKQLCDVVEQCTRAALRRDHKNFLSHQALIKDLLPDRGLSNGEGADSSFTRDVVMIVNREAKAMLDNLAQECDGQTYESVPLLGDKVLAVCWILKVLLAAKVAGEVVQCFVHLHAIPQILNNIKIRNDEESDDEDSDEDEDEDDEGNEDLKVVRAAVKLAKIVLVIYREVAAGNLLLKTPERVALSKNWHLLLKRLLSKDSNLDQGRKDLFSTLPFMEQMDQLIKFQDSDYMDHFNTKKLAMVLKEKWHIQL